MKKLIIGLVAVLLAFGVFLSMKAPETKPAPKPAVTAEPAEPAESAVPAVTPDAAPAPAETPTVHTLDYEAIRALSPADSAAITLGDQTMSWGEYAEWLRTNGMQYEDYFREMAAYYGMAADWAGSVGDGSGLNYAQNLLEETNDTLSSFMAIRAIANEKGAALDEEALEKLEPENMAVTVCGEGADVEQLAETLETNSHMSVESFRYYSESIALYSALYEQLYGAEGEKLSEEEVVNALEADGYLSAAHILFMTIDPMTGAALDADAVAEKRAQAEAVAEELRAVRDPEQRLARFAELKEQYCEDTGKTLYPDGYTFTPGTMVSEFEAEVKAQEAYDVSDPVQTSYGFHVIMRLPLSADSLLSTASGTAISARRNVAQNGMTAVLDAWYEDHPAVYSEELQNLDLTKYIVED